MVTHKINISEIKESGFSLKDFCHVKKKLIKQTLLKYGQIIPILVYKRELFNDYVAVKGGLVLQCMSELEMNEVFVCLLPIKSDLEAVALNYAVSESANDINALKLAVFVEELNFKHSHEEICKAFGITHEQFLVLKDMLKLDFVVSSRKDNSQQTLF